jgi:hypothetical protein
MLSGCVGRRPKPVTEITYLEFEKLTDEEFLDEVERKAFLFFWYEANPETGLVLDRASNFKFNDKRKISSVASVGFGLTALCIGVERGWVSEKVAYDRILKTLKFFKNDMDSNHGFYYHFVHMDSGEALPQSEGSSIDTAIFLAGALTAAKYFEGTEVEKLANQLYERTDWKWMLNDGDTLSMGWNHRGSFLIPRWNQYNEGILAYLLAIGSPTHPIPAESWFKITRPIRTYKDFTAIASSPLFTHQYPQIFVDLRDKNDGLVDYFWNSKVATLANRQFCIENENQYDTYGPNSWGLTACDGPGGYKVYGGRPATQTPVHDGTVAPTAAAGSFIFTPEESLATLKNMYKEHHSKLWGKYGFADAYNVNRDWYAEDVIGIDQGPLMLAIENARSGMVWKYFMKNKCIQESLEKIGFKKGTKKLKPQETPIIEASLAKDTIEIDGNLKEWSKAEVINLIPEKHLEFGNLTDYEKDLLADFMFKWDDEHLYMAAKVTDNQLKGKYTKSLIYRNDSIELFIDPEDNGLLWGNPYDFQIGLCPSGPKGEPETWAWFQQMNVKEHIDIASEEIEDGYIVEAAIDWDFLKIKPEEGLVFGISPAVHDLDDIDYSPDAKLNWYFINAQGKSSLGKITLVAE